MAVVVANVFENVPMDTESIVGRLCQSTGYPGASRDIDALFSSRDELTVEQLIPAFDSQNNHARLWALIAELSFSRSEEIPLGTLTGKFHSRALEINKMIATRVA